MTSKKPMIVLCEVYQDAKGAWRWTLKSLNGNILADSAEGYKRYDFCRRIAEKLFAGPVECRFNKKRER